MKIAQRDILLVLSHATRQSAAIISEEITKYCTITLEKAGALSSFPRITSTFSLLHPKCSLQCSLHLHSVLLSRYSFSNV